MYIYTREILNVVVSRPGDNNPGAGISASRPRPPLRTRQREREGGRFSSEAAFSRQGVCRKKKPEKLLVEGFVFLAPRCWPSKTPRGYTCQNRQGLCVLPPPSLSLSGYADSFRTLPVRANLTVAFWARESHIVCVCVRAPIRDSPWD